MTKVVKVDIEVSGKSQKGHRFDHIQRGIEVPDGMTYEEAIETVASDAVDEAMKLFRGPHTDAQASGTS
jgi:hypothetical protein